MKTVMLAFMAMAISIACHAQCNNSATLEETTAFINKSLAVYAGGIGEERYHLYKMDVSQAFSFISINADGIVSTKRGNHKVHNIFTIPINDISGNVLIKKIGNYSSLQLVTVGGKETIKVVISIPERGPQKIELMENLVSLQVRNDDNMPQRLKDALEHLFCLLGTKKDKF